MKLCMLMIFLGALELCRAKRILFILPVPSRSHYILNEYLIEQLAERGHEITIVAPFKMSAPPHNVTQILVPDTSEAFFKNFGSQGSHKGWFQMRNMNPLLLFTLGSMAKVMGGEMMDLKEIKQLMTSEQKFDLLLGESFLMEGLLAGLAQKFKAPLIMVCPTMPFVSVNEMVGNYAPAAYVPDTMLSFSDKMNFRERLINFLYTTVAKFLYYNIHIPQQDSLLKAYFGENSPPLMQTLQNSLIFVNHHFSLAFPRPYIPSMVEIGGYHVRPPKVLPGDLRKFMDEAKEGVIYFSMGSNLQSAEFPKEKVEGILRAFSRLKQKVLWKFEDENPPNLPKNVKISKWLPQSDILAHPNVKLFISHGGLLSLTESILRGVPVIGIPVFGDQPANVKLVERIEVGVKLEYDDLAEDSLYDSIREVLHNPKYSENVKLRSKILQDRPLSPIETAVFWVEFAMRREGAPHSRSGAQDLKWYQLNSLDVFTVVGFVVFVVIYSLERLLLLLARTLVKGKVKAQLSKKKNN